MARRRIGRDHVQQEVPPRRVQNLLRQPVGLDQRLAGHVRPAQRLQGPARAHAVPAVQATAPAHPVLPLQMEPFKTYCFVMDWRDNPLKSQEWYDTKRAERAEQGLLHIFAQEVDRDYAASVENTILQREWVEAAIDAHKKIRGCWPASTWLASTWPMVAVTATRLLAARAPSSST
jgi:hypothetical protein